MRKLALILLFGAAGCGGGSQKADAPAAAIELQPGQWEMTTQITNLSMTQGQQSMTKTDAKPITVSNCITREQIKQPQPSLFSDSKGSCSYDNFYMTNGRLNAAMKCTLPDGTSNINSTIDGSFTADTMTAEVRTVSSTAGAGNFQMSAKLTGKRVGECTTPPTEPPKS